MTHEEKIKAADIAQQQGDYAETERLCNEILAETDESNQIARAKILLGNVELRRGNYATALNFYNAVVAISTNDKRIIATANGNIGGVHYVLSDYLPALEYYQKAVLLDEELGNKGGVARHIGNIANVYRELSDFPRALEYHQKALGIYEELGHRSGMAINTGNIGNVYKELLDYPQALEYYRKALLIDEELGNKSSVASWTGNIGNVLKDMADYSQALEYYRQAISLNEELGNKKSVAGWTGNIGIIYANPKFDGYDPEKAEELLLQTITTFTNLGIKRGVYEFYHSLATLYKQLKRWEDYSFYFENFFELEKEVQSNEAKKQAQKFAAEREFAVIQKEQEILRIKNAELATLNAELEEKNSQLTQLNNEKNEFLGIAAHDLKNPLNSIKMLAKILKTDAGSLSIEEIQEFADDIHVSSQRMFDLIINLLDVNKIEQGKTSFFAYPFSPTNPVRNTVARYTEFAQQKDIGIVFNAQETMVNADENVLLQVLDNLISNAVKYSPHGKNIFVTVEKL